MKCKNCGKENLSEAKFCNQCGNRLDSTEKRIENQDNNNQRNIEERSRDKKTNIIKLSVLLLCAIFLFGGIKLYNYLANPKSLTRNEFRANTISYINSMKNSTNEENMNSEQDESEEDRVNKNDSIEGVDNDSEDAKAEGVDNDSEDAGVEGVDNDSVDAKAENEENAILDAKEDEVVADATEETMDDYLGEWYITEYGKPELNDEGRVTTSGTGFEISKDNESYNINIWSFFKGGEIPDATGVLEYMDGQWVAEYDEDGWGNSGQIILYIENGTPYITVTSVGGDPSYGFNFKDMSCTRIE